MKKKLSVFATVLAISSLSFVYLNQVQNINGSPIIFDNTKVSEEYEVDSYIEFKDALEDNQTDKVIKLEGDIDLSIVNSSDLNINDIKGENIIIDGGGKSIKNKKSDDYLTPLISYLNFHIAIKDNIISNFTIRNITLDNVGSFIGLVEMDGIDDFTSDISDFNDPNLIGKGLTFQNITIKNNKILNQNYTIDQFSEDNVILDFDSFKENKGFGFLANNITLTHSGGGTSLDSVVNFQNIVVKNNNIEGNKFTFLDPDNEITTIASSFLSNLYFLPSQSNVGVFNTFISYEYIFISNNVFSNNTIQVGSNGSDNVQIHDFNEQIFESFGNLSGNANGSENWIGNGKTYLYINDIYVENNYVTESKKLNSGSSLILGKYQYSELISNSNEDTNDQHINLLRFENIFSLNNEAYYLNEDGNYEIYSQTQINSINISTAQPNNNFNVENSKNYVFYGKMYDSNESLNLFKDFVIPAEKDSYYGRYLFTDTEEFDKINNFFMQEFGIYGYEVILSDVEQADVEQGNETKSVVDSISGVSEEKINILTNDFIYEDQDGKTYITKFTMDFRYYQPLNFNEDGSIETIETPFKFSNIRIYNNINEDSEYSESEIFALGDASQSFSINSDYSYSVELSLVKPIELTDEFIDNFDRSKLDNLYFGFTYSNYTTNKAAVTGNSIVKMDPDQLIFNFPGFPGASNSKNNENLFIILGSIMGLILLLILLIILILLFKKEKEKKTALSTNGYYSNLDEEQGIDNFNSSDKSTKKVKKTKSSKDKISKNKTSKNKNSKSNNSTYDNYQNEQQDYYQNDSLNGQGDYYNNNNDSYDYDSSEIDEVYYDDSLENENYYDNSTEIDEVYYDNSSEIDYYSGEDEYYNDDYS